MVLGWVGLGLPLCSTKWAGKVRKTPNQVALITKSLYLRVQIAVLELASVLGHVPENLGLKEWLFLIPKMKDCSWSNTLLPCIQVYALV